ncbi:hypothetical protein Ac2012v2_003751 [Leucoagaricus gongylophorus]
MARKMRTKGKDDDKGGGSKPVKVVTFESPKKGSFEQRQYDDWQLSKVSNSAAWGEMEGDGGWGQSVNWSSPTHQLPILPEVHSSIPTSPPPPCPPPASPDHLGPTVSDKAMVDSLYDDFQNPDHSSGSPLSNASKHIAPISSSQASSYVDPQSLTFTAAGVAMQKSKPQVPIQVQKYTSASQQAQKNMRIPITPRPEPPPAPSKPLELAPPANAKPKPTLTAQQWKTWAKGTPTSPRVPNHRFGSRDDYAVVAAAIERDAKRAVAAGHYPPQAGQSGGYAVFPKASGLNQQGDSIGWPQLDTSGWAAPKNSDVGGDPKSKRKNGASSGGYQQYHKHQIHAQKSSHYHGPMSKSWQDWGGDQDEKTNSETGDKDDEWDDQHDTDRLSEGNEWRAQGGDGWEGGWDDKSSGVQKNKSGWDDETEGGGWNIRLKGGRWDDKGGWDSKPKGGRWGNKPGESFKSRDNGGNTSSADPWAINSSGWDRQETDNWGVNQDTWGGFEVITDPPENLAGHKTPVPRKSYELESSWEQQAAWSPIQEVDEEDKSRVDEEQPQNFLQKHVPWSNKIDDTTYSMPSKTLAYAYQDTTTSLHQGKPRNSMNDYTSADLMESRGRALQPVEQALFGKARWAKDRIHWTFPPEKDERVSLLLSWIEKMSRQLGTFGLHKFLQSRERGALIVNAGFRLPELPNQPVFDWLTFDQLQATMDKIMQESVVFYDPATQVIVFVLLPSKSGNSVAMWRRKIQVPNDARHIYQQYIAQAIAGLKKELDYTVYVDRLPLKPEDPDKHKSKFLKKSSRLSKAAPALQQKKRKWWQVFKNLLLLFDHNPG